MIFILNKQEKVVNILRNEGGNNQLPPFFDDVYTQDLATGTETFSFSTIAINNVAKDLVVGNYVAFKDDEGQYKLFQITQTEEYHEEAMYISVYAECAGLELINKIFRSRKAPSTSLSKFMEMVLDETGWNIGVIPATVQESLDLELEDATVYSTLQANLSKYGVEMAFRCEINNGRISSKYVDLYTQRGRVTGKRFSFGTDIEGIKRKVDSTELFTALVGRGNNNINFKDITVDGINKPLGQDYVADQEAFNRYNNNGYHIVGIYNYDTDSPEELLRETSKQLEKCKQPKVEYEISVALLGELLGQDWNKVSIGDTISIVDNAFNPPIHLMARVSKLEKSFTDNQSNTCTLANFVEVQSNISDSIRKVASELENYVDSKFPIGSNDITEGAINGTHMDNSYMTQVSADIVKASLVEAKKIIADEIQATEGRFDSVVTDKIQATEGKFETIITDKIQATEGKFENIVTNKIQATEGKFQEVITDKVQAIDGKFEKVESDIVKANKVMSNLGKFDTVIAGRVEAVEGNFSEVNATIGKIETLVSGNISSGNIQTGGITGDNLNMATIFVDDANITNVNANKINAGTINTNNVHIESENGGIIIADNTQQFKDKNGKVRIQMGQDVQGNFNFGVYDEAGTGVLIDATGVKEKALADGIIKDRMIGQGEINGSKIDIDSLVSEVNKDSNTSVIKSSKVQLDTVGQTLDVAFNSLKSNVDNIQVGGRNLLLNSGFKNGMTYWEGHACNNVEVVFDSSAISGYATKFTSAGGGIYQRKSSGYYPHGTVLTVSGYVKSSVANKVFDVNFENAGGSNTFKQVICINENEWYYFTYTYTVDWNTFNTMTFYGQTGADYYLKDLKLEKGNKATDWTLAPEDIDSSIESVKQTTESNSTTIGVMQGQISTAINNTQIVKDGKTTLLKDDYNKTVAKVDSINSTIGTHTTKINDLTGNITDVDTKVNSVQRDLEGTKSTVSNHSTSITDLNSKVTNQNSSISQLKDQIALKVEATDIINAIDNLKIGGKNLAFKEALAPFGASSLDSTDYIKRGDLTVRKPEGEYNGGFHFDKLVNYKKLTNYVVHFYMTCTEYTIKNIHFHNGQNIIKSNVYIDDICVGTIAEIINTSIFNDGKTHKVRMEYTTPADLVDSSIGTSQTYFQPNKGISEPYTVFIQEFKVEEGNKATSWTPAPEDVDNAITSIDSKVETTKNQVAEIVTNVDSITQRVSATENTTSTLNNNLNNLQVGGRNLCTGTKDWSGWGQGSNTTLTDEYYQGLRVYTSNSEWAYYYQDIELEADTEYTISCWVKTNVAGTKVGCYIWHGDGEGIITLNEVDKWVRYTFTKTNLSKWTHRIRIESGNSINGAKLYLCGFKLEKGNKATDWTPAPEDIDNVISNVNSKIENTTNKVSEIVTSLDSINLKVQSTEQTVTNHTTQLNQVDNKINNAIDNIKIGGRNIIKKKSQFTYGYLSRTDGYVFDVGHLNSNQDFYANEYFELKQGETIWLSLYKKDIQSNIECGVYIHIYNLNKVWLMCEWKEAPANTNLQVSYTATENCYVRFNSRGYEHYNHKAEYGTKPTDWTPAPEDIDNAISNIQTQVNTTKNQVAEIVTNVDSITQRVQSTENTITTVTDKFNNLQVGGRNYCTKLDLSHSVNMDSNYPIEIDRNHVDCPNGFHLIGNQSELGVIRLPDVIKKNGYWTVSFDIRGIQNTVVGLLVDICDSESTKILTTHDNTWKRVSVTVNVTNFSPVYNFVDFSHLAWAHFQIRNIKVEEGNKATDWTPAPEDVDNAITSIDSKVETTKNQVAEIVTNVDSITQRVSATENTTSTLNNNLNNLQVGGRNLCTGTKDWSGWGQGSNTTLTDEYYQGLRVYTSNSEWAYYYQDIELEADTEYTISCWVKTNVAGTYVGCFVWHGGGEGITTLNEADTWIRYTFTRVNPVKQMCRIRLESGNTGNGANLYLCGFKLEKGNKATDWTPAPEDVDSAINNVNSKVESTKNQVASIETNLNGITQRVSNTEQTVTTINNNKEDKNSRYIFARGTGAHLNANSYVEVEGNCITNGQGRGLRINVLNPTTLEHLAVEDYDTYGDWNAVNTFIRRINELNTGDYIIIVTSFDASYPWRCKEVLRSIGGNLLPDTEDTYREAYVLIGKSRLGQGNGVEMYIPKTETDRRFADVSVKVGANGEFIGVNGSNVGSTITSLQSRISSAESKITPDAIINTVQNTISSAKNEAINSANSSTDSKLQNYATTSSLTQTANNLIAKFESSGGSNLIKNGAFKNGTTHWNIWGNPSAFHINHSENGYGHELRIVTNDKDQGAMQTIDHLRTGTAYTIACDVWVESGNCIMYVVDDSHWYLSSISSGTGWNKLSITFTPTSSSVSVRIGRGTEGSNGDYRFTAIRMYMGNVVEAWTPHHSESYDGIIKLDSNGIEVSHTGANTTTHMNSKGFFIYNSQGETVGSLATETGLSVVNANKVYADNINTVYQGDANLYVNHNHTGSNLGTSNNPFRSFADLKRHLESQPVINKNITIYVKTTSEITEQLTLTGLSGSGWIWIYYDKTCVHRQVTGGAYSIVLNNISNYIGIEGGRSNYNSSDGAVICDKWNAHGINITNCNNVYIGNINIHCQNWGIKVHRSRIRTWRVDFCGTWCCLDLSELSHGTDKDSCGGSAGGEFFRLYDGSIFLYGDTGGGYRPVGAKQEISGRYFLVGGERTATNSFRTPPPAPTTSDQYNTWSMNDYGYFTYGRNGINVNKWNPSTRRIQQGEWSGYGNNYGFAFFDHSGIRNWLANGTPKDGSTITLKRASSGGYSSSQPIYLHGATNTSCSGNPSGLKSYGNIGSLAWGETKTFNLPTSLVNDLKSGAIKSLCFYDSSGASYVKLESVSIKLKANKPV